MAPISISWHRYQEIILKVREADISFTDLESHMMKSYYGSGHTAISGNELFQTLIDMQFDGFLAIVYKDPKSSPSIENVNYITMRLA